MRYYHWLGLALILVYACVGSLPRHYGYYWLGLALIVLGVLVRLRRSPSEPPRTGVSIDAEGVRRKVGAIDEGVRWVDLERIEIQTTDEGPFAEDVFWLLFARDGSGCVVPGSAAGPLLDHVKDLSGFGFDAYQAIASAMGSAANASFLVWQRERLRADAAPARV